MPSQFAWVDFAEEDRRKVAELLALLNEQDTRDELGLGAIRDHLADTMFPGTSTIQTRARYLLFIPWIYSRLETKPATAADIPRRARKEETKLIQALLAAGETEGVIGREKQAELLRLPSNIYWAGLGALKIRRFAGSQQQYHRAWGYLAAARKNVVLDDDKEPVGGNSPATTWDPQLPPPPPDFPAKVTFELTTNEAVYLQQRILDLGPTVFGHLVQAPHQVDPPDQIWNHPQYQALPTDLRALVDHARFFSEAMHGAALLYNLMLAEQRPDKDWRADYEARFAAWAGMVRSRHDAFQSWDRQDFWAKAGSSDAHHIERTRAFVDQWLDMVLGEGDPARLATSRRARDLITDREYNLKRNRRRLGNPGALKNWNGSAGASQLNFRWHRVRQIIADITRGLGG
jgi:hypothetical protein